MAAHTLTEGRTARNSRPSTYGIARPRSRRGDDVIAEAMGILERRLRKPGAYIESPTDAIHWLALHMAELEREHMMAVWLDNRHRVIAREVMSTGTINGASVYAREFVKSAMRHNAAAVLLAHNHPSGVPEPSPADVSITRRLFEALDLVDVRVLDHVIFGGTESVSLAERGFLGAIAPEPKAKPKRRRSKKAEA